MTNWNEQASNNPKFTGSEVAPSLLASLEWRAIGPFRGGRVVAVAGDPVNPYVFYFRSTENDDKSLSIVCTACRTSQTAVTSLNPSGFSPEFARSVSTCETSAFTRDKMISQDILSP